MLRPASLIAFTLAVAGCTFHTRSANEKLERGLWSYAQTSSNHPSASFGIPYTAAQLSLECDPVEQVLHVLTIDTAIGRDRAVTVKVANVGYSGVERLDPPDGMAVARITIPLREPVLKNFAAKAGPMIIISTDGAWALPHSPEPIKMVQDCLRIGLRSTGRQGPTPMSPLGRKRNLGR